jgi:cytoskeletal protein RodZ
MDELFLGNLLKDKRTSLGLTLEQAAGETHIPFDYLEALEKEQFDRIPGEGYIKGFLRTYSDYLELDPDPVIDVYDTRYGNGMKHRAPLPGSRAHASKDSMARLRWRLVPTTAKERRTNLIVWLAICATLLAIWIVYYCLFIRNTEINVGIQTSALIEGSHCATRLTRTILFGAAQLLIF